MVTDSLGKSRGSVTGEWECDECGFVRRGTLHQRPPRNCPECGASAESFSFWPDDDEDMDDLDEYDEDEEGWEDDEEDDEDDF